MAPSGRWHDRSRVRQSRVAQCGALALCGVLVMTLSAPVVRGAPDPLIPLPLTHMNLAEGQRDGTELTPLWQQDSDTALTEPAAIAGVAAEASRMATVVAVLNRQGAEGAASLEQMAPVAVENPLPAPAPVIDVAAEQRARANANATATAEAQAVASATAEAEARAAASATAEAQAAASATAAAAATATAHAAATEVALSVEATVAARQAAAATATAVAVAELRAARATATAQSARAASLRATRVAAMATPENVAAVSPEAGGPAGVEPMSLVSLALIPVLLGVLAVRLWRRQEPFLLKTKSVEA